MSNTAFPGAIDSPTNPISSNPLNSPDHALQHGFANDALVAVETLLGVTGSAVNGTVQFVLGGISSGDKAVGLAATQTLTNKTLSTGTNINLGSDATGDMYYRNASGQFVKLAIGSTSQVLQVQASGIPGWVANPAASVGSTTVSGVFQEATQANVDAGTQTGSTGSDLAMTPNTLRARLINTGVVDTGSANAYAIAPSPAISAYAAYQQFTFKAVNANTTASTLAVNGLTAQAIKKNGTTALSAGDIPAGAIVLVEYDGTNFQLLNPVVNASTIARGFVSFTTSNTSNSPTLTFLPKIIRVYATCASTSTNNASSTGAWDSVNGNSCLIAGNTTPSLTTVFNVTNNSSNTLNGTIGSVTSSGFTITVPTQASPVTTELYWEAQA